MEEMRKAAMAYYANMSYDQKLMVRGFYNSIDTNVDGKVSIQEYLDFLKQKGYNRHVPPNLFKLLDKNNDGTLDFEECVTLFYMIAGHRLLICDGCRSYLWGLHFLCVECYSAGGRTFDLCCSCYRNNNFSHAHSTFLDNYALLRTKPREPKQEVSPRDDDDDDDDDEDDDEEEEEEDFIPRNHIVIHRHIVNHPPEKWPRAPSAYNNYIKEGSGSISGAAKNVKIKEVVEAFNTGWDIGTHVADIADLADRAGCTIM